MTANVGGGLVPLHHHCLRREIQIHLQLETIGLGDRVVVEVGC